MKVLKLSAQGLPQSWISLEQAVIHYASNEVRWESGGEIAVFRGGHNAITGQQSIIAVNSIIGTRGVPSINPFDLRPGLTNAKLFARDRNICAYCGDHFHETELTREHIIPFDRDSSALAAELFNKIGRPRTRRVDVMIAAIAIRQGAKLATLNIAHFEPMVKHGLELARVPGL